MPFNSTQEKTVPAGCVVWKLAFTGPHVAVTVWPIPDLANRVVDRVGNPVDVVGLDGGIGHDWSSTSRILELLCQSH